MTVPLLRVCVHCGYPTPGRHASSCRDADSGVVTVATPFTPAEVDALRRQVASLTAENERLRKIVDENPQWAKYLQVVEFAGQQRYTEDLAAENERLRRELDESQEIRRRLGQTIKAFPDAHHAANLAHCRDERDNLRAQLSSLRELESAVRKWRESHPEIYLDRRDTALIAAVDALPPTPPATEGSA